MIDDTKQEAKQGMEKTIEALKRDFKRVRTGRATPPSWTACAPTTTGRPRP